jgi:hypothetical protein
METESPRSKVEAIYQLRDAVEAKAQAEHALETGASPAARDALLAAQLEVEAKTQDAIDICHECGHASGNGHRHAPHHDGGSSLGNVVYVDFQAQTERA